MNEFFPLASAAGMTVGLAVCALIIGLVLAMLFAVLESVKLRPVAWLATGIVTLLRGLPEILVVLFIYFGSSQLLLTLSDGFTINLGIVQIPVQMQIENFDVSPFLCGAIALSLLTHRKRCAGRLKPFRRGNGNPVRRWDYRKPLFSFA